MAGHSDFSDSSNSLQQDVAARCLSLVDARHDEVSHAPEETSEGSLRQLLKGASGCETQLTSSALASFSLSQVSLPTEEELGGCPDLSNVVPPWRLKYLEGYRTLRGVDEYERIACQYVRLIKKVDRLHMIRCILKNARSFSSRKEKEPKVLPTARFCPGKRRDTLAD